MTLNSAYPCTALQGNGADTGYFFGFDYLNNGDIKVYLRTKARDDAGDPDILLAEGHDYTIVRSGIGGEIRFINKSYDNSNFILIKRIVDIVQNVDLPERGKMDPEVIEGTFDYCRMIDQQQQCQMEEFSTNLVTLQNSYRQIDALVAQAAKSAVDAGVSANSAQQSVVLSQAHVTQAQTASNESQSALASILLLKKEFPDPTGQPAGLNIVTNGAGGWNFAHGGGGGGGTSFPPTATAKVGDALTFKGTPGDPATDVNTEWKTITSGGGSSFPPTTTAKSGDVLSFTGTTGDPATDANTAWTKAVDPRLLNLLQTSGVIEGLILTQGTTEQDFFVSPGTALFVPHKPGFPGEPINVTNFPSNIAFTIPAESATFYVYLDANGTVNVTKDRADKARGDEILIGAINYDDAEGLQDYLHLSTRLDALAAQIRENIICKAGQVTGAAITLKGTDQFARAAGSFHGEGAYGGTVDNFYRTPIFAIDPMTWMFKFSADEGTGMFTNWPQTPEVDINGTLEHLKPGYFAYYPIFIMPSGHTMINYAVEQYATSTDVPPLSEYLLANSDKWSEYLQEFGGLRAVLLYKQGTAFTDTANKLLDIGGSNAVAGGGSGGGTSVNYSIPKPLVTDVNKSLNVTGAGTYGLKDSFANAATVGQIAVTDSSGKNPTLFAKSPGAAMGDLTGKNAGDRLTLLDPITGATGWQEPAASDDTYMSTGIIRGCVLEGSPLRVTVGKARFVEDVLGKPSTVTDQDIPEINPAPAGTSDGIWYYYLHSDNTVTATQTLEIKSRGNSTILGYVVNEKGVNVSIVPFTKRLDSLASQMVETWFAQENIIKGHAFQKADATSFKVENGTFVGMAVNGGTTDNFKRVNLSALNPMPFSFMTQDGNTTTKVTHFPTTGASTELTPNTIAMLPDDKTGFYVFSRLPNGDVFCIRPYEIYDSKSDAPDPEIYMQKHWFNFPENLQLFGSFFGLLLYTGGYDFNEVNSNHASLILGINGSRVIGPHGYAGGSTSIPPPSGTDDKKVLSYDQATNQLTWVNKPDLTGVADHSALEVIGEEIVPAANKVSVPKGDPAQAGYELVYSADGSITSAPPGRTSIQTRLVNYTERLLRKDMAGSPIPDGTITPFDEDTSSGLPVSVSLDNSGADAAAPTLSDLIDKTLTTTIDKGTATYDNILDTYNKANLTGSDTRFISRGSLNVNSVIPDITVFPSTPFSDDISNHTSDPIVMTSHLNNRANSFAYFYIFNHFIKFENGYNKKIIVRCKIDDTFFYPGNLDAGGSASLDFYVPATDNWTQSSTGLVTTIKKVSLTINPSVISVTNGYLIKNMPLTGTTAAAICRQIEKDYLTFTIDFTKPSLKPNGIDHEDGWSPNPDTSLKYMYIGARATAGNYYIGKVKKTWDQTITLEEVSTAIVLPTDHKRYDLGTINTMQTSTAAPYWQGATAKVTDIKAGDVPLFLIWQKDIVSPFEKGYTFDTSWKNHDDLPSIQLEDGNGGVVHTEFIPMNPRCVAYRAVTPVTQDQIDNWIVVLRIQSTNTAPLLFHGKDNFFIRCTSVDDYLMI